LKTFRSDPHENARDLAEKIEIYTPGNETVSPFRFNPLSLIPGISIEEHIDNILSSFKAAIPVEGSLPALLGEALEQVYEDHPDRNHPPIMADLIAAAERRLAEKGYSPDTNSDFRAALEVRLGVLIRRSVGRIFQCSQSIPSVEHLMEVPTIIEFDRLHTEQASLLALFLLTQIREYLKTDSKSEKDPRFVIIIEEAHTIVGRTGPAAASPDVVDPKAFAADYVVRMLAELRALGVGIVIVDQLPSAVAPEVIKNTATKLAFRQVAKEDRDELGAAMLLGPTEIEDIARLETGEAFFFTEGYHMPRRIWTTNLHDQFNFNILTINSNILPWLLDDSWYQGSATERIINELSKLLEDMDRFDNTRLKIIRELASMMAIYPQIRAQPATRDKINKLEAIKHRAQDQAQVLSSIYDSFLKNSYRKYLHVNNEINVNDNLVKEMRNDLAKSFRFNHKARC